MEYVLGPPRKEEMRAALPEEFPSVGIEDDG